MAASTKMRVSVWELINFLVFVQTQENRDTRRPTSIYTLAHLLTIARERNLIQDPNKFRSIKGTKKSASVYRVAHQVIPLMSTTPREKPDGSPCSKSILLRRRGSASFWPSCSSPLWPPLRARAGTRGLRAARGWSANSGVAPTPAGSAARTTKTTARRRRKSARQRRLHFYERK